MVGGDRDMPHPSLPTLLVVMLITDPVRHAPTLSLYSFSLFRSLPYSYPCTGSWEALPIGLRTQKWPFVFETAKKVGFCCTFVRHLQVSIFTMSFRYLHRFTYFPPLSFLPLPRNYCKSPIRRSGKSCKLQRVRA